MHLNEYGRIAHSEWEKLPERFENLELDVFQIMPNHMHGILILRDPVGAGFTPALGAAAETVIGAPTNPAPIQPSDTAPPQGGHPQGAPLHPPVKQPLRRG